MSVDYQVWCEKCHVSRHIGQAMGSGYSFGFGKYDTITQSKIMEFIANHVSHESYDPVVGCYIETDEKLYLRIGHDSPENYKRVDSQKGWIC